MVTGQTTSCGKSCITIYVIVSLQLASRQSADFSFVPILSWLQAHFKKTKNGYTYLHEIAFFLCITVSTLILPIQADQKILHGVEKLTLCKGLYYKQFQSCKGMWCRIFKISSWKKYWDDGRFGPDKQSGFSGCYLFENFWRSGHFGSRHYTLGSLAWNLINPVSLENWNWV